MIIHDIPFPFYKTIMSCSIIIGILYVFLSLKNENISKKNILLFFIFFFIITYMSAKTYTFVVSGFKKKFLECGLSSYGGLIGVIISPLIYEKIYPSDKKIIKYSILSLPLIYSFGKIGCFFVGCCYGIPYNGPFSVTYPHGLNIPLFPIQLLESFVFFILFLFCNTNKNKKNISYITLLLISILKFSLDFLRYSHIKELISSNQIFSVFLFIITAFLNIKKNTIRKK